jgi:hypothetical protein
MNPLHIKELLSAQLTDLPIYMGEIPDGAAPAIGFVHIASPKKKSLSGDERGTRELWRITIIANSQQEGHSIKESVLQLNNTYNSNFQRVTIEDEQWHGDYAGAPIAHYSVDLQAILR